MTNNRARLYDVMLLITYSVRHDAEARGYDDWLRQVDNPFFNAAGGVAHYSNWKIAGDVNPFAPNTHFDFLAMTGRESLDRVWNDPELNRFRDNWRRLWGVADPSDPAANSQTYLCERISVADMPWDDHLALVPASVGDRMTGWDTWRVVSSLRDTTLGFDAFHVRFVRGKHGIEQLGTTPQRPAFATCIAAPGPAPDTPAAP